ncbi:MAG: 50S ribosomal protein L6 [Deltaproteobacteria bacterium]|nr:50S ribosomal protein L6 [Deltaproteobacteria bacterium]
MSRIGKQPVAIPDKVKVTISGQNVKVEGPKGKLDFSVNPRAKVAVSGKEIIISRVNEERETRAVHGLTRAIVANMVKGVSTGFHRGMEINGVGFRAEVKGQSITLTVGYSHPVEFPLPPGITAEVEKQTKLTLHGADKQLLGATVAKLRAVRPPEPYKGKGIKYTEEHIIRKEGKTGAG